MFSYTRELFAHIIKLYIYENYNLIGVICKKLFIYDVDDEVKSEMRFRWHKRITI